MRLAFLVATLAAFGLLPPSIEAGDPHGLKAGVFLYAAPETGFSSFTESVVLLVEHGREGSLGLIVNRPTPIPVREVLKDLGPLDLALYFGGPVQPDVAVALVRSLRLVPGAVRVLPDVYFCPNLERIDPTARTPDAASRLRIYAGYAGWSPGQLAGELRRNAWVIGPADARSIFSSEPDALWPRVHELLRRIEAHQCPDRDPRMLPTGLVRTTGEIAPGAAR
jgi:putative transcriptional regulator